MITDETRNAREMFMAISIIEHHISPLSKFSTYDLCERLTDSWRLFEKQARENRIELNVCSVMEINNELSNSLGLKKGTFLEEEKWLSMIDEIGGSIEKDPDHILSWVFSSLYWNHLTQLRLATAWFYTNALRIKLGKEIFHLSQRNIGDFLDDLSGSGPPIYDGQCFYPDNYSSW